MLVNTTNLTPANIAAQRTPDYLNPQGQSRAMAYALCLHAAATLIVALRIQLWVMKLA